MARIRLVDWDADQARARAARIRAAGHTVDHERPEGPEFLRAMRKRPPDAFVIDLGRAPSQGRDLALALRAAKATRAVPLLFVGGSREKRAEVRALLPDALYTTWGRIGAAIGRALRHPPVDPVVPASPLAGYSGTPLAKKLGIKPGQVVALSGAPPGFARTLGKLPDGVTLRPRLAGRYELAIWFVRSARELERGIERVAARIAKGMGLWIAWPKRASGLPTDLSQAAVRKAGLAAGLVDYKICAVDATWSALKFTRRR